MKLQKYSVINYKSAKLVTVSLNGDKVNTFIGVNDCGKSTLLQALKLFFDEKPTIAFQTDTTKKSVFSNSPLNNVDFKQYFQNNSLPEFDQYNENLVCIYCCFEIEKDFSAGQLDVLSPQLQCRLADLKSGDTIHLLRTFNIDGSKSDYYLLCDDFMDEASEPSELWNQNQAAIKSAQTMHGIKDSDIENRNSAGPLKNVERILAIYNKIELIPVWSKFDFKKDAEVFPTVRYLDWNISTDEINQLTAEVIKPVVSTLLEPIQAQVRKGSEQINTKANSQLQELYKKYSDYLPKSITGISANVNINLQQSVTELFVEKQTADKRIHIDEQGDGIRRQIGLGLINALAQESLDDKDMTKKHIWCFDEPETHLFPQAQRDLANSLSLLAKTQFQILVSTHSTLFVDKSELADINQVCLEDYYTSLKTTASTEDIYKSLGVRNSDFLFFDRFIAVEGATEFGLMDHLYRLVYGTSLMSDGVQLINLGGATNSGTCEGLLNDIFNDFQKPEDMTVYLFDKDTGRTGANIFLVGQTADFEDEISNAVWVDAVQAECALRLTSEQLDTIRSNISTQDANKKFWKLLDRHISRESGQTQRLPSKGEALATLLSAHIKSEDEVPQSIKDAFETVRRGITE